jgi:hypothetical protein
MNTFSISTIFKNGFHWGWRISIIYISFALSTLGFMFFSLTQKVDLVSDTYYKEELNYEKTIAAKRNSSSLSNEVLFNEQQSAISIVFPFPQVDGIINMYRPSSSSSDKEYSFKTNSYTYVLPIADIPAGLWIIKVTWKQNNTMFYNEYRLYEES